MQRGISRRPRLEFDELDSWEDITDILLPTGGGTIEFYPPEFEEPSFFEFLWEEVIQLGLFRGEISPEITITDCEICIGVAIDISLYETAQGKGARVCYRFEDCKPEEAENIEDPPKPLLPKPDNLLPTRSPPSFGKAGHLIWCTSSESTERVINQYGQIEFRTTNVNCGEWIGDAKGQQESFTFVPANSKFQTYISEIRGTRIYSRSQYWVFVGQRRLSHSELVATWERAQKDDEGFIGPANIRNGALVFWLSTEYYDEDGIKYFNWNTLGLNFTPLNPYLPPPQESPEDFTMKCCKNQRDQEALLRKIAKAVGTEDFPVNAPRYLTDTSGGVSIKSIPRFQRYIVEQLDALIGQFPLEVEIQDVDPTQQGNQTERVKLPNLAETLGEIYGLLTKTAVDGDVSINFLSRLAFELMAVKSATLITQSYARGNAAYLGYQGNLEEFRIRSLFNIDANSIDKLDDFLKEDTETVRSWVNEDENTVQAYLERLMFAASIIKETHVSTDANSARGTSNRMIDLLGRAAIEGLGSKAWEEFMRYLNTEGFVGRTPGSPQVSAKEIDLE